MIVDILFYHQIDLTENSSLFDVTKIVITFLQIDLENSLHTNAITKVQ